MILVEMCNRLLLTSPALHIVPPDVPASGADLMPQRTDSFGQGLLEILHDAIGLIRPDLQEALVVCASLIGVVILVSICSSIPGFSCRTTDLIGAATITILLFQSSRSLIRLAASTITEITEYGKLLLPVMTTALAAQGGVASSAALYSGTMIFLTALGKMMTGLLLPLVYIYMGVAVANSALEETTISSLRNSIKGASVWMLKTILYIFTGYMAITGVVSGTTDASALKAAKLTIASAVPIVGGIISDASEAILVSAGMLKNAAGIYGMLAAMAVWLGPFLKIGTHYLLLKGTGFVCEVFGNKKLTALIQDFSSGMGLLLAMTGTVCLLLLISVICFLKGGG